MSIINKIVKIITFIGTIFRASHEQRICKKQGLMVEDVKYFASGNNCGHVAHELPKTKKAARRLCLSPLFRGFFLGLIILIPTSISIFFLENFKPFVFISYWIGISLWTNIFPSRINAHLYRTYAKNEGKALSKFIAAFLEAGSILESSGLSLLTSILASFVLAQIFRLILPLAYIPMF